MASETVNINFLDRYPSSPVTDARAAMSQLVDKVRNISERHVLTRHGRPVAAIIGLADLRLLEVAHDRARAALTWPDDDLAADEVEDNPIGVSYETAERVEFEDLVRQTLDAVKHDEKLRAMMVGFLEQDDKPSAKTDSSASRHAGKRGEISSHT